VLIGSDRERKARREAWRATETAHVHAATGGDPTFLSSSEGAEHLGITPACLERLRRLKLGPLSHVVGWTDPADGRFVYLTCYRADELMAYKAQHCDYLMALASGVPFMKATTRWIASRQHIAA
jgi:hypothetical protein